MSELEMLTSRAQRLEADRDALAAEIEQLRGTLEEERAVIDARTKKLAAKRRQRRTLITLGIVAFVVIGGATAWTAARWLDEETLFADVTEVRGAPPVTEGEACALRIERDYGPFNAWLVVQCGDQRVYGFESFGSLSCDVAGGRAVRCEDEGAIDLDGDPRLRFDRAAGTLELDDGRRWGITMALRE